MSTPSSLSGPGAPQQEAAKSKPHANAAATAPALLTRPQNDKGFLYNLFLGPGGGATLAGMCEIVIFHPFDTVAKRPTAGAAQARIPGQLLRRGLQGAAADYEICWAAVHA